METKATCEKEKSLAEKRKIIEQLKAMLCQEEKDHGGSVEKCRTNTEVIIEQTETILKARKENEAEIEVLAKQKKELEAELFAGLELEKVLIKEEDSLKKIAATNNLEIEAIVKSCEDLSKKIETITNTVERAQLRDQSKFELRKDRHNFMQELKGNIRVYCRVRPRLPDDPAGKDIVVLSNDKIVEIAAPHFAPGAGVTSSKAAKTERFVLDKVFEPIASQEDVFAEVSSFVRSVLDGYNVCIFAYGQTGTGKTYTMEGDLSNRAGYGIIPRCINQIFSEYNLQILCFSLY